MTENELKKYLKENLRLEVTTMSGWYGEKTLHTRLYLDNDLVSEYETSLPDCPCEKSSY